MFNLPSSYSATLAIKIRSLASGNPVCDQAGVLIGAGAPKTVHPRVSDSPVPGPAAGLPVAAAGPGLGVWTSGWLPKGAAPGEPAGVPDVPGFLSSGIGAFMNIVQPRFF